MYDLFTIGTTENQEWTDMFGGLGHFCELVKQSGQQLYRLPTGKTLINQLANYQNQGTIVIKPCAFSGLIFGYIPEMVIRYNPINGDTRKPIAPHIALGHELIHVLHAREGVITAGLSVDEKMREEERTVGLGNFINMSITENQLRLESGLPPRRSYA